MVKLESIFLFFSCYLANMIKRVFASLFACWHSQQEKKRKIDSSLTTIKYLVIITKSSDGSGRPCKVFERRYAQYLFTKHIVPSLAPPNIEPEMDRYMGLIFIKKKSFISQHEYLRQEIDDIRRADIAYNAHPEDFPNHKTEYGYPDKFRCNYINLYKHHKLSRCAVKITAGDEFYCKRHGTEPNKHIQDYQKAVESLDTAE